MWHMKGLMTVGERGRDNFEPLFLKLNSPPGCIMGKRGEGGGKRKECAEKLIILE